MSTLAFAQLTNVREAAPAGESTTTAKPGIQTYVDVFAALVPSEVLALHGLIIATTTEISQAASTGSAMAQIRPEAYSTLKWSFWGLLIASVALYVVPRRMGGTWGRLDYFRVIIAPLAFVGWTMLQRTTAFDAVFPQLQQAPRTVIALFLGAFLGAVTAALATRADSAPPPTGGHA
jgi:uncharacterized membrane protein YcjF (UPF0283 family)